MQTSPAKTPLRKWLASALSILAFAAAYFVFSPHGRDLIGQLTMTDASIRAKIETSFHGSQTYEALKAHFPETYEELIAIAIKDIRAGASRDQSMSHSAELTAKLRQREAQHYAMASLESLRLSLLAQLPHYSYLKSTYGFRACNEMAVNGGMALMKSFGSQIIKDSTFSKLMDEASGTFFRTAAEGKRLKTQYEQPTEADWQIVASQMNSSGMTDADLQLMAKPEKHVDDPRLCDVVIKFYSNIATMQDEAGNRIIPYLAAAIAAG